MIYEESASIAKNTWHKLATKSNFKNESQFTRAAIAAIQAKYRHNVWVYKPNDLFRKGVHDLVICFFGLFVTIELKNEDAYEVQPLQEYNITAIRRAGGISFTAFNLDDALNGLSKVQCSHLKSKKKS